MTAKTIVGVLMVGILLSACAGLQQSASQPVVIKAEDLVGRGYERVGQVQVTRERLGAEVLTADDFGWANGALQEEARKMGADAILQPELFIKSESLLFIPVTEIRARATAIRFR
jgi:uncharacterized protein YbjQ (UPF0145 family)